MAQERNRLWMLPFIFLILLSLLGCKGEPKEVIDSQDLSDLNVQIRPYTTVENTKVRTGPGPQFRAIGEIRRDAKVQVVGRDGDWVLIVSKKGNPPGYVEMASVEPSRTTEKKQSSVPVEGKYESVVDARVHSGPGLHYPVLAEIKKGTKINVVDETQGWLKVESRRGNKPGYVEASVAKPVKGY
ncbi:MAG TPA: SH3 domain-containing protein [Candidatus Binatia bacterium]|nr:SH3 domain-containing protein [Candidatus Binatia bacterium]